VSLIKTPSQPLPTGGRGSTRRIVSVLKQGRTTGVLPAYARAIAFGRAANFVVPSPRLRGEGQGEGQGCPPRKCRGRAPHPPFGHLLPACGEKGGASRASTCGLPAPCVDDGRQAGGDPFPYAVVLLAKGGFPVALRRSNTEIFATDKVYCLARPLLRSNPSPLWGGVGEGSFSNFRRAAS
jgi:hypothetical protein